MKYEVVIPIPLEIPVRGESLIQAVERLVPHKQVELVQEPVEKGDKVVYKVGLASSYPDQDCLIRVDGSETVDPSADYSSVEVVFYPWDHVEKYDVLLHLSSIRVRMRNLGEQLRGALERKAS